MDPIKEAFSKIKEDIHTIQKELADLRQEIKANGLNQQNSTRQDNPTDKHNSPTQTIQQTNRQIYPTDKQTKNRPLEPLKATNNEFSIGNKGVPTDKQTNKQTLQQTDNSPFIGQEHKIQEDFHSSTFEEAEEAINALNALKEEIKKKFQALTPKEMLVFSTIYVLQEQNNEITYKVIANNLNLSESSIRDYVNRLILKKVPITKKKVNNKLILLSIASSLYKNLSLSSIIELRGV
jgi:hypothetical protein